MPFNFSPSKRYPDPRLHPSWNFAQLGLLLLPMSPLLGSVGLLLATIGTWKQRYKEIHRQKVNRGFALLALWLVITTCFAANRQAAWLGLFNFLPFFAFFAAFSALIQTPAQLRRIAWILVATSLPVVIIGWGQLFWGWAGPVQLGIVLDWRLEATGTPPGRMASVFAYANVLANYFLITLILGMGLWLEAFQALRSLNQLPVGLEKVRDPRDPRIVRLVDLNAAEDYGEALLRWVFLSVAVLGNAIALLLTNSRNAWAIAACACVVFALYRGWRWLVAGVAGAAGSVLAAAFGPTAAQRSLRGVVPAYFWARLSDELYPHRHLATLRTTQWQFAWKMTLDRPLTGWGLRNFTPLYQQQMQVWLGHPHNLFLMLTAETGIPATLALCGLVSWVLAKGLLMLRSWPDVVETPVETRVISSSEDRLIFFSYLVAFGACTLFSTLDVALFDARVNILGWLLLAAVWGVVQHRRSPLT